jgi:hypothetical protein
MTARIRNSTLQNDTDQLSPLVNPQTNAQVANFPADSAALSRLSCKLFSSFDIRTTNILPLGAQWRALGTGLAMTVPGAQANAAAKSRFYEELRTTIGLRPHPA